MTEEIAGETTERDAAFPRLLLEGPNHVRRKWDFVVAVSKLADHLHGAKPLRVIRGVVGVPKLGGCLVAGKFLGDTVSGKTGIGATG